MALQQPELAVSQASQVGGHGISSLAHVRAQADRHAQHLLVKGKDLLHVAKRVGLLKTTHTHNAQHVLVH